jgi:hypothetical protein
VQFSNLKKETEKGSKGGRHQLCSLHGHVLAMLQNKIRNVQRFKFPETEGLFSKALDEKFTNEWQIASDGRVDQPSFRAQMFLISIQNVSER